MLRENTVFAQKIIDFYTDKGIECSVVDEHLSLLVTLFADGRGHEFRYGNRAFAGIHHFKKFYLVLEREFSKLKSSIPVSTPPGRNHLKFKSPVPADTGEEENLNI